MLTRPQQILIKRAQREAALPDSEYRDDLETVSGCRSSKDPRLTQHHLDNALKYFEAIYWQKVDQGELQPACKPGAVFAQRGYWKTKNTRSETSRDRYAMAKTGPEISALESALDGLGFGATYCAVIRQKVTHGREGAAALNQYRAALERTLRTKRKQFCGSLTRSS